MIKYQYDKSDVDIQKEELLSDNYLQVARHVLRHKKFNGDWSQTFEREVVHRGSAVSVILYDPALDTIVLVEQFRLGALSDERSPWLMELVAGVIDAGEDEVEVAVRETKEETGITITAPKEVYRYYTSPGICSEQVILYYAECDSQEAVKTAGLEYENEDIKVHVLPREDVFQHLHTGQFKNVNTIAGLQWLQFHLQEK